MELVAKTQVPEGFTLSINSMMPKIFICVSQDMSRVYKDKQLLARSKEYNLMRHDQATITIEERDKAHKAYKRAAGPKGLIYVNEHGKSC